MGEELWILRRWWSRGSELKMTNSLKDRTARDSFQIVLRPSRNSYPSVQIESLTETICTMGHRPPDPPDSPEMAEMADVMADDRRGMGALWAGQ